MSNTTSGTLSVSGSPDYWTGAAYASLTALKGYAGVGNVGGTYRIYAGFGFVSTINP